MPAADMVAPACTGADAGGNTCELNPDTSVEVVDRCIAGPGLATGDKLGRDCSLFAAPCCTFVATSYTIASLNNAGAVPNTDFPAVGAADNAAGTEFIATGPGAGTGLVFETCRPTAMIDDSADFKVDNLASVYIR